MSFIISLPIQADMQDGVTPPSTFAGIAIIAAVLLGLLLIVARAWTDRFSIGGRVARSDYRPSSEVVNLNWLIVSDRWGREAIWELDGDSVAADPFCPNDLFRMFPVTRAAGGKAAHSASWQCSRCAHCFEPRTNSPRDYRDMIAGKFNERLDQLGKPASISGRGRST